MRTLSKTLYEYNELSDAAKDVAREWLKGLSFSDSSDWGHVYDDAKTIGAMMGIDIDDIEFSGFWCQGDGARFTGRYKYAAGGVKAVTAYASQDTAVQAIAKRLQAVQRKNFYKLVATVSTYGNYSHSGSMQVEMFKGDNEDESFSREDNQEVQECLRAFADWLYRQLEKECEHQQSDEYLEETIEANEYEFYEDGERV